MRGAYFLKRLRQSREAAVAALADAVSPPADAPAPTLPLAAYVGTYRDPWYGDVRITGGADGLAIDMGRSEVLDGPLTAYRGDTFVAIWPDRSLKADAFVTFSVENGAVTGEVLEPGQVALQRLAVFEEDAIRR